MSPFQFNYASIADSILNVAKSASIDAKRRAALYDMVKKFVLYFYILISVFSWHEELIQGLRIATPVTLKGRNFPT